MMKVCVVEYHIKGHTTISTTMSFSLDSVNKLELHFLTELYQMSETILITMLILCFAMSFSIGSNDAANALGTSYGSNAAKLWILLILGAIFEFVGAVWCSSKLAGTLPFKIIPTLGSLSIDV